MRLALGTIKGRHPLPVERYVLEQEVVPGQTAYDAAYLAAEALGHELAEDGITSVDLYYTGLTEVTLGCLDGLEATVGEENPIVIVLRRYDAAAAEYQPLRRGLPPAVGAERERHALAVHAAAREVATGRLSISQAMARFGLSQADQAGVAFHARMGASQLAAMAD